jgi:hypothetical protein
MQQLAAQSGSCHHQEQSPPLECTERVHRIIAMLHFMQQGALAQKKALRTMATEQHAPAAATNQPTDNREAKRGQQAEQEKK